MNLLCPHCQKAISVSEEFAGKLMQCPLCTQRFTAPSLPVAAVHATPASERAPVPPPPPPDLPRAESSAGDESTRPGYRRSATITLNPAVVPWIGFGGLILALILTFFPWLVVYTPPTETAAEAIAGHNPWGLAFGKWSNALSVLYLLFLVVGVLVAVATMVLPLLPIELPAGLKEILPWRSSILLGIVTMAFAFLILQLLTSFDAEKLRQTSLPSFTFRTNWLRGALLLHLIAVVGYGLEFWLALRKNKPLPRMDLSW
jgi:hypothetical protein